MYILYYIELYYNIWQLQKPEKGVLFPGTRVTESCELLGWYQELKAGLLKEWTKLLPTESSGINSFSMEKQL